MNRLAVAYFIHLDGNSKVGAGGFDYRWQDLAAAGAPAVRVITYAFYYLQEMAAQQWHGCHTLGQGTALFAIPRNPDQQQI
ncbi:MAG: hypothetical protein IPK16_18370 [Anaerolineales bacterium]|nr:hypothetical protein [Anaerolineales bacterium]